MTYSQPAQHERDDRRQARARPPGDGVQARRSRPSSVACGERAPPRRPRPRRSPLRQRPPGRTTRRIRRRGSSSVTRNPQVLKISQMRSSLMIEGELPEDGLAALEGNDQDVMLDLARRLADQRAEDASSLEAPFAQRREAEAKGADYLVGGGWDSVACVPKTHGGDD